jgi:hypothetical protein
MLYHMKMAQLDQTGGGGFTGSGIVKTIIRNAGRQISIDAPASVAIDYPDDTGTFYMHIAFELPTDVLTGKDISVGTKFTYDTAMHLDYVDDVNDLSNILLISGASGSSRRDMQLESFNSAYGAETNAAVSTKTDYVDDSTVWTVHGPYSRPYFAYPIVSANFVMDEQSKQMLAAWLDHVRENHASPDTSDPKTAQLATEASMGPIYSGVGSVAVHLTTKAGGKTNTKTLGAPGRLTIDSENGTMHLAFSLSASWLENEVPDVATDTREVVFDVVGPADISMLMKGRPKRLTFIPGEFELYVNSMQQPKWVLPEYGAAVTKVDLTLNHQSEHKLNVWLNELSGSGGVA